jgi:hypothetical protein
MEDEPTYIDINCRVQYNSFGKQIKFIGWYKEWFYTKDSQIRIIHRTNGPARMWEAGLKEYWLNDINYPNIKSDEEWLIKQIIE